MILSNSKKICKVIPDLQYIDFNLLSKFKEQKNVEGLVCSRDMARTCINLNFPSLSYIQLTSVGFDGIDLSECKKKGITVCNAANVYNVGMAEFVVYALLMRAKQYNHNINNSRCRLFRNYKYITELAGKTVGILGVGGIGSEIAKRLNAFDMNVIGYANRTKEKTYFSEIYHYQQLVDFVSQCDYLVSTLPFNNQTKDFVNKTFLSYAKRNVTFINVGRKATICDKDLISFLKANEEACAILDMFEYFPNPITNPYRRLPNVKILPGVTAISQEINEKLIALIKENLIRFNKNEELLNIISR